MTRLCSDRSQPIDGLQLPLAIHVAVWYASRAVDRDASCVRRRYVPLPALLHWLRGALISSLYVRSCCSHGFARVALHRDCLALAPSSGGSCGHRAQSTLCAYQVIALDGFDREACLPARRERRSPSTVPTTSRA